MFNVDFYRKLFKEIAEKDCSTECTIPIEEFSIKLHQMMQNPEDGQIIFDGCSRSLLHNGNLVRIADYFDSETGDHILGKTIDMLKISNMRLSDYYDEKNVWSQMPDGTPYIAELIGKNPKIKVIDLSYTQLGDKEADILIKALESNTRLCELNLEGNSISEEKLRVISEIVERNSAAELSKPSQYHPQYHRPPM